MISIEIKVNGELVEKIVAINVEPAHAGECGNPCQFFHKYIVNGIIEIEHARIDGHRELARKMLEAVKKFKK